MRVKNTTAFVEELKQIMANDKDLRSFQRESLDAFINPLDDKEIPEKGIFNLATGLGKTRLMCMMAMAQLKANEDQGKKSKVVIVVPNIELLEQEKQELELYNKTFGISEKVDIGLYYGLKKEEDKEIILTTYNSLDKLGDVIGQDVGLLLLDEAHHGVSDLRQEAIGKFEQALWYGMTATPFYSPDRDIQKILGDVISEVSIKEAIEAEEPGLSEVKNVFMVSDLVVDLSGVKKDRTGDYNSESYGRAIMSAMRGHQVETNEGSWEEGHRAIAKEVAKFYRDYVDEHLGKIQGRKCLISCRSQEEARIQANEFNKLFGFAIARVHTSDECDDKTINDFKNGSLPIVCQVNKLSEGFDMPNLDMVINYPTASRVRATQCGGRALRLPQVGEQEAGTVPKKMALVVDIAFKHPESDNIMDSIHKNGQVLFCDIVGSPFVQHKDPVMRHPVIEKGEIERLRVKETGKEVPKLSFTVISDVQELIRIHQSSENTDIPQIQEGMMTVKDILGKYVCSPKTIYRLFGFLHEKKVQFETSEGTQYPLIIEVKGRNRQDTLVLHPLGLEAFKKVYYESERKVLELKKENPQIQEGMMTVQDISDKYVVSRETISFLFDSLHKEKVQFNTAEGTQYPLIIEVKGRNGKVILALHPLGEDAFKKVYKEKRDGKELELKGEKPQIQEGMMTAKDISDKYVVSKETIYRLFGSLHEKKVQFNTAEGTQERLIIEVKKRGQDTLALHPLGEEAFKKVYYESKGKALELKEENPQIQEGMMTAPDICGKYVCTHKTISKLFKDLYGNKVQFETSEGIQYPLIIEVKGKNRQDTLVLHPLGEDAFKKVYYESEGKELELRGEKPQIQEGMMRGQDISDKYVVSKETIYRLFDSLYKEKVQFNTAEGTQYPLIIEVKGRNGRDTLALHPQGEEVFKEVYKERFGKELRLKPKLVARQADKGKRMSLEQ